MKPSEQLRELAMKWKSWIGSDTFENSIGCGNEGDVYSAGSNDFLRRNIPDLESLIPAVERLEQAQPERDAEIRTWLSNIINHTQMDIDASREISKVIKKLEGGA